MRAIHFGHNNIVVVVSAKRIVRSYALSETAHARALLLKEASIRRRRIIWRRFRCCTRLRYDDLFLCNHFFHRIFSIVQITSLLTRIASESFTRIFIFFLIEIVVAINQIVIATVITIAVINSNIFMFLNFFAKLKLEPRAMIIDNILVIELREYSRFSQNLNEN